MATATLSHDLPQPVVARPGTFDIRDLPPAGRLYWLLRVGVALEFLGHGMAGLARSKAWFPYYELFGISQNAASHYMFYVTGAVDITLAVVILVRPMRAVLLHMTFWGLMTAALRPMTGESFFELVERSANYGMPLAFLALAGWGTWSWRDLFSKIEPPETVEARQADVVAWVMRVSIALLLVGHGGLGIWAHKAEWTDFFGFFGIGGATVASAHLSQVVGWFEVALGVAVLLKPARNLLLFVLVWKVGTELLRPLVGQPLFQFIERSGDYVLPVSVMLLAALQRTLAPAQRESSTLRSSGPVRHAQATGRPYPQLWHVTN